MPGLIYCKAENVYALLYRESIVRKYDGRVETLPLLFCEVFLNFELIALNLRGEVIV